MPHLNLALAFAAGVLGFFSPCIVPLIPGYLSFVSGVSLAEMEGAGRAQHVGRILGATALFVLGFSVIFTALGASSSIAGAFVLSNREVLSRVGGVIVILLGFVVLGAIPVPGLSIEHRLHLTQRPAGWAGVLLVGAAFGFAWIPCVGPILGAILTLAATTQRAGDGATLLFVYALGLGLPFLTAALLLASGFRVLRAMRRYLRPIQVVSGLFLVVMGASLLFDWVYRLDGWILQVFPFRPAL